MNAQSQLLTPLMGAQLDPVTGEPKANVTEERLILRGARWWMQQWRIHAAPPAKTTNTQKESSHEIILS